MSIKTKNVQTHFSRAIATKDMILNQIYQVQTCENKEYWKDMARKEYSGPWLLMVLKYMLIPKKERKILNVRLEEGHSFLHLKL